MSSMTVLTEAAGEVKQHADESRTTRLNIGLLSAEVGNEFTELVKLENMSAAVGISFLLRKTRCDNSV